MILALLLLGVTAVKLWAAFAQPVQACPYLTDDVAYLRLGASIARGEWLGPYDQFTLVKGPAYPAWVALVSSGGISLPFAQQLLYAVACAAFTLAVAPLLRSRYWLAFLYLLLLLNPMSFAREVQRVVREGIYPAETLLVCAGIAALVATRRARLGLFGAVCAALGAALSAFWLTREEGLWLVPAVALGAGAVAVDLVRSRAPSLGLRLLGCALPAVMLALVLAAVERTNFDRYGVPSVVELKAEPFEAAMGATMRVGPHPAGPAVPVPRSTWQQLADASPAFRELLPDLQGRLGKGWASVSQQLYPQHGDHGEIAGSWWLWAIRDAAAAAGRHREGAAAMGYYARMAKEINTACKDGRLLCGPRRKSVYPPLGPGLVAPALRASGSALAELVSMRDIDPRVPRSPVGDADAARFREVVHHWVAPLAGAPPGSGAFPPAYRLRIGILQAIGASYRLLLPALGLIGLFCFGAALARSRALASPLGWLCAALLASVLARVLLLGVITAVSFRATTPFYLAPAYPLWIAFCVLAVALRFGPALSPPD